MRDPEASLVERLWWGAEARARAVRWMLAPASLAYRAVVSARNALYDAGALRAIEPVLPAVSIGNVTVGGTGKTPVAAWIAGHLATRGARPAIVLRGYGDDEPLVHERLNPGIPVVVDPDRVRGIAAAAARGADVAVLDDAFQHRRVRRAADIVLVSADRWSDAARVLPAGPYREPRRALRRADLVVITRKAADAALAQDVAEHVGHIAPEVSRAIVALAPGVLRRVDGDESEPVRALVGAHVAAIAAIGDPAAFTRQLGTLGARVRAHVFPDHHRFTSDEVQRLASGLARDERPLCTLKDAVKLGPLWPRVAPPLWYVSQHLMVERGGEHLEELLTRVLRARHTHPLSPPAPLPATPS